MSNIILFDHQEVRDSLLPLTFTRPVANMRIGILTIAEKWEKWLNNSISYLTEEYLSEKFPISISSNNLFINGALCPNEALVNAIAAMDDETRLESDGKVLAIKTSKPDLHDAELLKSISFNEDFNLIDEVWKIFQLNADELKVDFAENHK